MKGGIEAYVSVCECGCARPRDYINLCKLRLQLYAARKREKEKKTKTLTDSQRKSVPFKKQIFSTWIITEEISSQGFNDSLRWCCRKKNAEPDKRKSSENLRLYNVWSIDARQELTASWKLLLVLDFESWWKSTSPMSHFWRCERSIWYKLKHWESIHHAASPTSKLGLWEVSKQWARFSDWSKLSQALRLMD